MTNNYTLLNFIIFHLFVYILGGIAGYFLNGSAFGVVYGGMITLSLFFVIDRYLAFLQSGSFMSLEGYETEHDRITWGEE